MNNELELLKSSIKKRRFFVKPVSKNKKNYSIEKYLVKFFMAIILTLTILIGLKSSKEFSSDFYQKVYSDNLSFAVINQLYQDTFGSPIPFKNLFKDNSQNVFKEKLKYNEASKFKDGVKLTVDSHYLVPAIEGGIIIFVGEKDEYGYTVIMQQTDGIDIWYSNLDKSNVKLYDYVESGSLIGEVKDTTLYLIYQKEGKALDYTKYLP